MIRKDKLRVVKKSSDHLQKRSDDSPIFIQPIDNEDKIEKDCLEAFAEESSKSE